MSVTTAILAVWMGQDGFEKWYLFTSGKECCTRYFPSAVNCPYENTVQTGYYWESYQENRPNSEALPIIYNHTYYPDLNANTCINGTDYPSWMAEDDIYKRLYLYKEPEGCCMFWFGHDAVTNCVANVIQSTYIDANTTAMTTNQDPRTKWYPKIQESICSNDGNVPTWMLNEGYSQWYLFNTKEACCSSFDCSRQSLSYETPPGIFNHTYYPDLNANTCINGTDYPSWMAEDEVYKQLYLYEEPEGCCMFWFGHDAVTNCVTNIIQSTYIDANATVTSTSQDPRTKWYPKIQESICSNDGNVPTWMLNEGYSQWYLFNTKEACCSSFDCSRQSLSYETPPGIFNHTYYPDLNANTCINGTDYPSWMAEDEVYKQLYLYEEPEGCCMFWFGHDAVTNCVTNIIQSTYSDSSVANTGTTSTVVPIGESNTKWYPKVEERICSNDGNVPPWMLSEGYSQWYLFNTKGACCSSFDCSGE